jgi:hypothetical protein
MARGERISVAKFHILGWLDARPFGARAQEPAALTDARGVEGVAGDEELHALAGAEV